MSYLDRWRNEGDTPVGRILRVVADHLSLYGGRGSEKIERVVRQEIAWLDSEIDRLCSINEESGVRLAEQSDRLAELEEFVRDSLGCLDEHAADRAGLYVRATRLLVDSPAAQEPKP